MLCKKKIVHHLRTNATNLKRKQECRLNVIYQSRRSGFIRALLRIMCNARDGCNVLVSSDYCRRRRSFSRANHPGGKVYFEFVHLFVNRVARHIRAFARSHASTSRTTNWTRVVLVKYISRIRAICSEKSLLFQTIISQIISLKEKIHEIMSDFILHASIYSFTRGTLITIFSCQWRNNRHGKLNNKFVTHEICDYTIDPSRNFYFRPSDRRSKHVCD